MSIALTSEAAEIETEACFLVRNLLIFYIMDNWTDKAIQRHIDDLIEESYLLSRTDREVRSNLINFVAACEATLRSNLSLLGDIRITKVKIALLRTHLFLIETRSSRHFSSNKRSSDSPVSTLLARYVAHTKCSIMRLLNDISPDVARTVSDEFVQRLQLEQSDMRNALRREDILRRSGYYLLLFFTLLVLCGVSFF